MNAKIVSGYAEYSATLGLVLGSSCQHSNVKIARVEEAFGRAYQLQKQPSGSESALALFQQLCDLDGSHPAVEGTYLAALSF